MAAIKRKQARRRTAKTHQITTELTHSFKYIALEDLKVKNMTASAKGTEEEPGKKVRQKAGLNRAVLNVSFYKIREQLLYKAEKSGTVVQFVDPKGTSQTCIMCGHKSKTNRKKQTKFKCTNPTCGHEDNADVNAAKNILRRANPSAALELASKIPTDLATIKASGSCFQPVSALKTVMKTGGYPHVR